NLRFTDTINADSAATQNRTLVITAGTTGLVRFEGSVGATEAFADLDVTGGQIELLGSSYVINDGAGGATSTWTGAVTLLSDVTFLTDGASDNSITFNGSIDSDSAATARSFNAVAGTGVVILAGAGGGVSLADLDVSATTLSINTATLNVSGGAGGGVITLNAAVILGANVTISTTGAVDNHLLFQSTINADSTTANDRTLVINSGTASVTFNGDIGGSQGLADLDVTAAAININAAQVRVTDGASTRVVTLTGAIRVGSNLTITTDGVNTDGNLEIRGLLDADDASAQDRTLTLLAGVSSISILSPIGTQQAFADLDITASTINLNGATINVTDGATSNTVSFTGNTVVGSNLSITTTGAVSHNVSFSGSLNADNATANDRTLMVNAGTGTITVGAAGVSNNVGGTQAFADLDLMGSTIRLNVNSVTVNDGPGNAQVTFDGNVVLAAATITINTDGDQDNQLLFTQSINSDAAATPRNLTLTTGNAPLTFLGSVGTTVTLGTLSLTSSSVFLSGTADLDLRATTIRLQTATLAIAGDSSGSLTRLVGNVQVGANLLINTRGANGPVNNFEVTGTINADSAVNFDRTLTIDTGAANVTLGGNVGATQALADLDISAAVIRFNAGTITVNDGPGGMTVTLDGDVVLGANMTITTTGQSDNRLLFTKTINADSAANNRTLILSTGSESATLLGSVGSSQTFSALTFINGSLLLGGTTAIDLVATSIRLQTPLVAMAGESSGALIRVVGDVRLQSNVVVNTTGTTGASNSLLFTDSINADDSINQNRTLQIQAGTGVITFQGNISTSNAQVLADLDVTAALIRLQTTSIGVTDGPGGATVTFDGKVEVGANLTITTDGTADNNLLFTDTIDADDAATQDRTLVIRAGTTGTVRFNSSVGTNQSFADLDVTALQTQLLGSQYVINDGAGNATLTWTGAVVLLNNVSFITNGVADNNLTFSNRIDADDASANDRALSIDAGQGTVNFLGNLGATQALADLDILAASIRLTGASYNIQDGSGGETVTFAGSVVVIAPTVTINTDGVNDNKLLFTQSINADSAASNRTLNLTAGNESITLQSSVGATQALGNLSLTSNSVLLNGNTNLDLKVNTLIRLQTNTLALAGDSSGALIRLIGNVQVAANLLINTLGTSGPGNNLEFTGTINADSAENFD
ncbi:MAG: beta strand repeat-containing protein, partial [Planctomycetota bacterium]